VGNKKFILETKDISKYFDRFKVLSNINIKLEEREFLTIFGANGAGKTTLLKIIAMLLKPNSGVIYFNGIDTQRSSDSVRKSIGFITHNTFLYNDLSAYENLKLYSILYDVKNCEEQINIVMEKVGLLRRSSEPIRNFSKGMHQRLAIARAFLHNPTLLLLDEPYSGLDQKALNVLNQMLENFHNEGKTAIITTHNIERGMEIADKVVVLNKGSIVFEKNKKQMEISEFKNMYVEILNTQL
jgi:heme exporter protein A